MLTKGFHTSSTTGQMHRERRPGSTAEDSFGWQPEWSKFYCAMLSAPLDKVIRGYLSRDGVLILALVASFSPKSFMSAYFHGDTLSLWVVHSDRIELHVCTIKTKECIPCFTVSTETLVLTTAFLWNSHLGSRHLNFTLT